MAKKTHSTIEVFTNFINEMIDVGYLTKEKIAKFCLFPYNVNILVKAYAVHTFRPFSFNHKSGEYHVYDSALYLTDSGKDWFFSFLQSKPYEYLHKVFNTIFRHKEKPSYLPELYRDWNYFSNYKGLKGKSDVDTNREVRVTHTYGPRNNLVDYTYFDSLAKAREYIFKMSRTFPIEQFVLHYKQNCGYWRKTKPYTDTDKRGAHGRENLKAYLARIGTLKEND